MHGPKDICLRRLAHGVLLVVGQNDHVFPGVAEVLVQVRGHVPHIVYATAQLPLLTKVIDPDQESLLLAGTIRVLEAISLRRAITKRDGVGRRGRGGVRVPVIVRVLIRGRSAFGGLGSHRCISKAAWVKLTRLPMIRWTPVWRL